MPQENNDHNADGEDSLERLSEMFDKLATDKSQEEKDLQIENLCGKVEEVLSTYMIIGYSVDGEPVTVTYAKNKKDSDALALLFNRQIANSYYGSGGNNSGNSEPL